MRRLAGMAALALAACQSPEGAEPLPYVVDDEAVAGPALDVGELEALAAAALDGALLLRAEPVLAAYETAVQGRDDDCPLWFEEGPSSQWYGGCTAESGARFSGNAGVTMAAAEDVEAQASEWAHQLVASATIATPEGRTFSGGGAAVLGGGSSPDGAYGYSAVLGSFAWDGPEADGTWLAEGHELDLQVVWQRTPEVRAIQLHGSILMPDGAAVNFDGFTVLDAFCRGEPAGTMSLRTDDGWYDVLFDLDIDAVQDVDPDVCDGCGSAWFRGEEVGQVCLDVAELADFGDAAW